MVTFFHLYIDREDDGINIKEVDHFSRPLFIMNCMNYSALPFEPRTLTILWM